MTTRTRLANHGLPDGDDAPDIFVRLSRQTTAKQAARHPDVTPDDYARLQQVFDGGAAILEKDRTLVCTIELDEGKWWRVVVKRTADRRETFLVAFHRIKPNQATIARRRGRLVRPAKGMTAPGGAQSLLTRPKPRV